MTGYYVLGIFVNREKPALHGLLSHRLMRSHAQECGGSFKDCRLCDRRLARARQHHQSEGRVPWSRFALLVERHLSRARVLHPYRHVLIDSRTGFTDTSGICTMLMPEVLVVVFSPNRQGMGVLELVREAMARLGSPLLPCTV